MNSFNVEFTQTWWRAVVADPARMAAFLQKLYKTELSGYTDHLVFLGQEGSVEERTAKILLNIALDELKHSHIIQDLMTDRGIYLGDPPDSVYWQHMNSKVTTLAEYCAVNHYGEALAAFRFETILEMPETPSDIKNALRIILPDEQFHRVTLEKLAGTEALANMSVAHDEAVDLLKRGILQLG